MKKITRKLLPYFLGFLSLITFGQNSLNSQVFVGVINASDPDSGQSLTFKIIAGNADTFFSIHPATGTLMVKPSAFDSFFSQRTWTLTVAVTDNDKFNPQSSSATILVTLKRDALSGKIMTEIAKGD
ncbi:MAG: cadherin repeat domain-containing protein [Bacteroidales bacterium]|nr:cadherin repeat domain-containing protein [Bacteroidales bacterium]